MKNMAMGDVKAAPTISNEERLKKIAA